MGEFVSLEDYKRAYREIRVEEERRDFTIHLVVYLLVNAMLIVINVMYSPEAIWFFYPLIGWGIGITIHYLNTSPLDRRPPEEEGGGGRVPGEGVPVIPEKEMSAAPRGRPNRGSFVYQI
ncbi:MAG: 2TM domain-containing protein [Methanomicrobiales archaeon]